jgi:hypothetical protein
MASRKRSSTTGKPKRKPSKPAKPRKGRIARGAPTASRAAAVADRTRLSVTFAFNLGTNPPSDALLHAQIDSRPLTISGTSGGATIGPGRHTTSWSVISPTTSR